MMNKNYTLVGGNGVNVSLLTVTEDGTYVAGDSAAYNPVIVATGGPGDFSTATVSITNTAESGSVKLVGPCIVQDALVSESSGVSTTGEVTVVLYKGSASVNFNAASVSAATGDIEGNLSDGYTITGDCAVTGAAAS